MGTELVLRLQDISTHDINYIKWLTSCFTWGRIPITHVNMEEWLKT